MAIASARTGSRRKWIYIGVAALIVLPILGFWAWSAITLAYTYSQGERAGYVQKISQKGWLCKTYEGELALVSLPGAAPEIWKFTVRDKKIADEINGLAGEKVALTYEQHVGVPTDCFGETEYYVVGARKVAQ